MAIGMVWTWMGVGVTYFSSASARMMGSARPKSWNEVNGYTFYRARRADSFGRRSRVAGVMVDTPRVLGCQFGEIKGRARSRLTGIRTRGSPGPNAVALPIWGIFVLVARSSWLTSVYL